MRTFLAGAAVIMIVAVGQVRSEDLPNQNGASAPGKPGSSPTKQEADEPRKAVDKIPDTPRERYVARVKEVVWGRFRLLSAAKGSEGPGRLSMRLYFEKDGALKKEDFKIISSEGNPLFAEAVLRAVLEAKFPPIPAELLPELKKGLLEVDLLFVVLP